MTIAACYVSPEGVVLGADSTTSHEPAPGSFHYFNHNQKLFELGDGCTLGVVTWGLAGLGPTVSYRTLFATLADDLLKNPPATVREVADRWSAGFWDAYSKSMFKLVIDECRALHAKKALDPKAAAPDPAARDEAEEKRYSYLRNGLFAGFCIGGYLPSADLRSPTHRVAQAFQILVDPVEVNAPIPAEIIGPRFWGAPNMIDRLIVGCDGNFKNAILASGKWQGTPGDLDALINQQTLVHGLLPIREAIDFVHTCIYGTIKALKFSSFSQICGGPIELAVITTDRPFRWVRHKEWDAAIIEGSS